MSPAAPWLVALAIGAIERGEASFKPTAAEAAVPEVFRLKEGTFVYELEPIRTTERYTVSKLRFPSPIDAVDDENDTVHAEYFRPSVAGRRPAVVVLHILGADFALSRYLAARLADRGVAALFVQLPYYGNRRPKGTSKRFLSDDVKRSVGAMRQGVCDVRRAAAWLAGRPEVDPERIGVAGISLGGIVAADAAAADPAIRSAVILLAGGDLAEILWNMPEPAARRARQRWIDAGLTKGDLRAVTEPLDPLTYADRLVGKRVLMMAGRTDEVIPPASARALWEKAGRPPIHWYDCGHYSAAGFLLPAIREAVAFFEADAR
ncbi:MAG TPA: dienelactone hydrolase family protein [Isosphaeraceae bacterium]|jgi:dienelactone hydrolase|nr:dienelactone hydrolase family protein [Isosphaeraceae bacterium]